MVNPQGIVLIIIGVLFLPKVVIEFFIRTGSIMRGVKTEITKGTIIFTRIIAVLFILLGLLFTI